MTIEEVLAAEGYTAEESKALTDNPKNKALAQQDSPAVRRGHHGSPEGAGTRNQHPQVQRRDRHPLRRQEGSGSRRSPRRSSQVPDLPQVAQGCGIRHPRRLPERGSRKG